MQNMSAFRSRAPVTWRSVLQAACIGAAAGVAAPAASAGVVMDVASGHVQLAPATGPIERTNESATGGEVRASIGAPGLSGFGPTSAEAFANEDGTFWTYATTGTLEAYNVFSTVDFTREATKRSVGERVKVEITGGYIELTDTGGLLQQMMSGTLGFSVLVNGTSVIKHQPTVRGNFDSWELSYFGGAADPIITDHFATFGKFTGGGGDDTARYVIDPVTIFIPLDDVAVGETYEVRYFATSDVTGIGGETAGDAYFRDPLGIGSRVSIVDASVSDIAEPSTAWLLATVLPLLLGIRRPRR